MFDRLEEKREKLSRVGRTCGNLRVIPFSMNLNNKSRCLYLGHNRLEHYILSKPVNFYTIVQIYFLIYTRFSCFGTV